MFMESKSAQIEKLKKSGGGSRIGSSKRISSESGKMAIEIIKVDCKSGSFFHFLSFLRGLTRRDLTYLSRVFVRSFQNCTTGPRNEAKSCFEKRPRQLR